MKIIYAGSISSYGGYNNSLARLAAFIRLGHEIAAIDTTGSEHRLESLCTRLSWHVLDYPLDLADANKRIIQIARHTTFDVLWVDNGLMISARTLKLLKKIRPSLLLVHHNSDDPFGRYSKGWKRFLQCLPFYDVHFVPRDVNIPEYYRAGAKRVLRFHRGYNPDICRPLPLTSQEKFYFASDIGFIGSYEQERADKIQFLAESGISVSVRGGGWQRLRNKHHNLKIHNVLYGNDYAKAICATKINLHFLREGNRDNQNTRTFEIPACGGFMLAERTDEHQALFLEGKEAEFFSDTKELVTKIRYYLCHERERERIAAKGRERCLQSGYSALDRCKEMLEQI